MIKAFSRTVLGLSLAVMATTVFAADAADKVQLADNAPDSYVVKKGDTLTKIALKNGTTLKALKEMNGLGEGGHIYPGQSIVLE